MTKESLFSFLFRRSRLSPPQILPELPKEVTELRPDVHQIYSDHQLLVSHLIANPKKAQAILQEYLDSPEFSHDSQLFGQFISACLFKFNPNPSEAIRIAKEAEPLSLDRGLQRIQTRVLRKLLKTINPTQESASLPEVGQEIAQQFMQNNHQLPQPVLNEYQRYIREKTLSQLGLNNTLTAKNLDKEKKRQKSLSFPPNSQIPQESGEENQFHYRICYLASANTDPIPVPNGEKFGRLFKSRGLNNLTAEEIFARIQRLEGRHPTDIHQQYSARVAGGPFAGWHEILVGKTGRILFKIETLPEGKHQITFCAGSHEVVYATKRRKPPDRSRSL